MKKQFLVFFLFPFLLNGQTNTDEQSRIRTGFEIVQQHAIQEVGTNIQLLQIRKERLTQQGFSSKQVDKAFDVLWHGATLFDLSLRSMKRRVSPQDDPNEIFPLFEKEDYKICLKNDPLFRLMDEGIVKQNQPHDLVQEDSSYVWQEFLFYQLKDSMKIGEIGAGSGIISLLISTIYKDVTIYVNELESDKLKYIKNWIANFDHLEPSNQIIPVKGKYESTQLGGKELDILILRDVFHHFSEMEAMLQSMKTALKENGIVILIEALPELDTNNNCCLEALPRVDLVSIMSKNGFTLLQERDFLETAFLKFQKN